MTRAHLARVVAAATLVVAATCVLSPTTASASADPCASGSGVTVVIDPGALGGALTSVCDGGSGQVAAARYADVGVSLSFVQRQPGFVCRVNDAPATDPCVNTPPTDAYWALWWTDGESGSWTYASIGVTGLQVPDGGAVALVWQSDIARRAPGIPAPVIKPSPTPVPTKSPTRTASPTPTSKPTSTPTTAPTSTGTTSATTSATTPAPTASSSATSATTQSPSPSPSTSAASESPTAEPSTPNDSASATEPRAADEESRRVPTWLTLAILVMLLVAIGMSTYAARRRTRH